MPRVGGDFWYSEGRGRRATQRGLGNEGAWSLPLSAWPRLERPQWRYRPQAAYPLHSLKAMGMIQP